MLSTIIELSLLFIASPYRVESADFIYTESGCEPRIITHMEANFESSLEGLN